MNKRFKSHWPRSRNNLKIALFDFLTLTIWAHTRLSNIYMANYLGVEKDVSVEK